MKNLSKLNDFFESIKPQKVGIVTHVNADPDGVGSACGIYVLLRDYFNIKRARVIFPEGPSRLSKKLMAKYTILKDYAESVSEEDAYIIVDAQSLETLGREKDEILSKPFFIIDHHQLNDVMVRKAYDYVIREEVSACILVYEMLKEARLSCHVNVLNLLAAGIIFDSKRFLRATPRAFKVIYELLRQGIHYNEIIEVLSGEMDVSERIARLKAAKRASLYKSGKWIIAFANVSAFEASAARALIELGADLAFVASESKGHLRISARSTSKFYKETSINLALDVMKTLCTVMEGTGGGHKTAAGFNGRGRLNDAFNFLIRKLEKLLGYKLSSIT